MKKKFLAGLIIGPMMLGMTGAVRAGTIFHDNIDIESTGLNKVNFISWNISADPAHDPATMLLMVTGVVVLIGIRRKKKT